MCIALTTMLSLAFVVIVMPSIVLGFDCAAILRDPEIAYLDWPNLEECLRVVNSDDSQLIDDDFGTNVWRLTKAGHRGIESIPATVYRHLGASLVAIPLADLRNISMDRVEVVEAFGSVSSIQQRKGFSSEQLDVIAQKVVAEWPGKTAKTYSQYDLISLGEIICHINLSIIREVHVDAFKYASESIGRIRNCPADYLKVFAEMATRDEAFGPMNQWSKLEVSIIGNIINGFPATVIAANIDKDKLHLNRFYQEQSAEVNRNPKKASANGNNNERGVRPNNLKGNMTLSDNK